METAPTSAHPGLGMTQTIVLCGVDETDAGTKVLTAAKAASQRSGAPLLLTHVVTSLWGADIPAFKVDDDHRPPRRARPARRAAPGRRRRATTPS